MSTIGSLAVNVVANTEKFSKGMKTARKELDMFEKAAISVKSVATSAFLGVGAALVAGFSIREIRATISALDDLGDAATRLGTSAKSLGGLQHAAFMSDVSSESLVKSLTIMEKNVANGAKAFDMLGLSVDDLKQLDAAEMFIQIAESINKMQTPAERTAAAMATFGKSGASLLELISTGRDGIQAAMYEAERMGLAPSDEDIKQIQEVDAAIKHLTETYKGLKNQVVLTLSEFTKSDAANMLGVAVGGKSKGQNAWDNTINALPDKQFRQMQRDLALANKLPWAVRGIMLSQISEKYFKSDVTKMLGVGNGNQSLTGGNRYWRDAVAERAERERWEKERATAAAAQRAKYSPWLAGKSFASGLASGYSISGAASGVMGSLGASGPAWAAGRGPGALFDYLVPQNYDANDNAMKAINAGMMSMWMGGMMGTAQTPNEFAGQGGSHKLSPGNREYGVRGNAALEQGSAAAFSQERRSAQASQLAEQSKQQTKLQTAMTKSLDQIDKNLKSTQKLEVFNIA